MLNKSIKNINERVLNSVGKENYNEYMLLTNGREIDKILDNRSPVYQMYEYKKELLNKGIGQDITVDVLKELLKNNNDIELKKDLEKVFLDYLSDESYKTIKDILDRHKNGWNIKNLLDIHRKHKYYRIFSLLTIKYNDWLTI